MFRRFSIAAAATLALATPLAAQAQSWDVVDDFSASVFQYGRGDVGTTFWPLSIDPCDIRLICYNSGLPGARKNISGADFASGTAFYPVDRLLLHPGAGYPVSDALLRFTAPTAGVYQLSGEFSRLDTTANGNGVTASIVANIGGLTTSIFSVNLAPESYGSSTSFGTFPLVLAAGDWIEFGINNNNEYSYDSTGLSAVISTPILAVPEPATWAMMLGGFGLAGAALRRKRGKPALA